MKRGKILLFAGIVLISASLLLVRMGQWSGENKKHVTATPEVKRDDFFKMLKGSDIAFPPTSMITFDDADSVFKNLKIKALNKYAPGIYAEPGTSEDDIYFRKTPLNDSVYIVAVPKKPVSIPLYFQVWGTDHLLTDWTQIDFNKANILDSDFYKLAVLPEKGHFYKIRFSKNKKKEDYALFQAEFRTRPLLVGVFFPEQEDALNDALLGINPSATNKDTSLPKVNWKKYQPEAQLDTFHIDSLRKWVQPYPSDGLYVYSRYNTILFLYSGAGDSTALEYQLTPESIEADTLKIWHHTLPGNYLIKLSNIEPGEYRLKVRYNRFNSKIASYSVIIRPMWYETHWANWSKGFLLGLSIVIIPFLVFKRAQKARLRKKEQERTMLDLQMKSYRAQLNPHFIFNALTSIQGLINKQDTAAANRYLASFSRLLRKTLDEQVAAFWTLQDELDLLQQYIELEQLRFGIQYGVHMAAGIQAAQIPFPSMLLQPVVENAVRHGISGMTENGRIDIHISGTNEHFTITVEDNGRGFDVSEIATGNHGLRLTRERVALFNNNNNGHIDFSITSGGGKTTATFYFEHL